ncbi:hypothetical protein FDC26_17710 [Clostridium botulinum]|uniref:hypothetical protein n=1 Tax=unclassified Clostridium TaxID=2614128 RepID=UPI0013CA1939|nr:MULTISPECIES: hypothetical protein [unclassified Clostridium]NFN78674.1 hypothetical protein [Clostridium botulinum]NFO79214.1 hypothetical protein [Clostridium botulinum]NFP05978.1 hypothetical protein [Clostridium botulinum]NFS02265.1 hypothetical protein [Clostridium botulinum]NFT97357.1 hypothetical protein [Clostridium botulinum]
MRITKKIINNKEKIYVGINLIEFISLICLIVCNIIVFNIFKPIIGIELAGWIIAILTLIFAFIQYKISKNN